MNPPLRVLVFGAGAVGLGLASALHRSGRVARLALVARPETAAALRRDGIRLSGIFGEHRVPPGDFEAAEAIDDLAAAPPFDRVLVCVKSFDSAAAAASLAARSDLLAPDGALVLFQNGWGNREVFAAALPAGVPIYNARVITGFARSEPNAVEITVHAQPVAIGSIAGEPLAPLESLAEAIEAGGLPSVVSPEVAKDMWSKILYNCALNPLGAILGASYGELAARAETRSIMDRVFDEVFAVMRAEGFATHWPDAESYRRDFYGKLVPPTAAHLSSMLRDLRAGRRAEIDSLTGAIAAMGRRRGIPTPTVDALDAMVRFVSPGS